MFKKIEIWVLYLTIVIMLIFSVGFGILVKQNLTHQSRNLFTRGAGFLVRIPDLITEFSKDVRGVRMLASEGMGRFDGLSGFVGKGIQRPLYLLLSRYDGDKNRSTFELVDLSTFKTLHIWEPDIDAHNKTVDVTKTLFASQLKDRNARNAMLGPGILFEDGSLVYNNVVLERVDINGDLLWQNQDAYFHHMMEKGPDGNIWVCVRYYPYASTLSDEQMSGLSFKDEGIAKVSLEGEILFEKTVRDILVENGYEYIFGGIGDRHLTDPVHLNDVQPALTTTAYWKKGDVFLSLRNQSMVLHYRPDTDELINVFQGETLLQHDVDIIDAETMSFFDNNAIHAKQNRIGVLNGHNRVVQYNFRTREYSSYLEESMKEYEVKTSVQGGHETTQRGELLVEDTKSGRILFFNPDGSLQWQYVNRAEDGEIYAVQWASLLHTPKELQVVKSVLSELR